MDPNFSLKQHFDPNQYFLSLSLIKIWPVMKIYKTHIETNYKAIKNQFEAVLPAKWLLCRKLIYYDYAFILCYPCQVCLFNNFYQLQFISTYSLHRLLFFKLTSICRFPSVLHSALLMGKSSVPEVVVYGLVTLLDDMVTSCDFGNLTIFWFLSCGPVMIPLAHYFNNTNLIKIDSLQNLIVPFAATCSWTECTSKGRQRMIIMMALGRNGSIPCGSDVICLA